jgi:hypothetical protein
MYWSQMTYCFRLQSVAFIVAGFEEASSDTFPTVKNVFVLLDLCMYLSSGCARLKTLNEVSP